MSKLGKPHHVKRLAAPKALPITDRKSHVWIVNPSPGPHSKHASIPLMVLLRDVLGVARTGREIKKILASRFVKVDGKTRTDAAFPVGFMDVVHFSDKVYRIMVDSKARLVPSEISEGDAGKKIAKVVGKYATQGGKISILLHDGRTMLADNNIHVGDSVVLALPDFKLDKVLKLEKDARCFIREGKHAGAVAKLEEIIRRGEGKDAEARLSSEQGQFVTVAKYLFVVDDSFSGVRGAS